MEKVNGYMKFASDQTSSLSSKHTELVFDMTKALNRLDMHDASLSDLQKALKTEESFTRDISERVNQLQLKKADLQEFEFLQKRLLDASNEMRKTVDQCNIEVETCSNYMEKYMPLTIQRQISEFVEYVMPSRETRWRVNWYNEIKIPMLTSAIMYDSGRQSLQRRVEMLDKIVTENMIPALPKDTHAMTPEEEFTIIAVKNRQIHAKAKLLIMQMLNQIQKPNKEKKEETANPFSRKRTFTKDYTTCSVAEMFNDMLDILKKENPAIVKQLLAEGKIREGEEEVELQMQEELQND